MPTSPCDCAATQRLDILRRLRHADILCDITVYGNQDESGIRAHKLMLISASKYLRMLHMQGELEGVLHLDGVSAPTVAMVVSHLYGEPLELDDANIDEVEGLIRTLQMEDLLGSCIKYKKSRLDVAAGVAPGLDCISDATLPLDGATVSPTTEERSEPNSSFAPLTKEELLAEIAKVRQIKHNIMKTASKMEEDSEPSLDIEEDETQQDGAAPGPVMLQNVENKAAAGIQRERMMKCGGKRVRLCNVLKPKDACNMSPHRVHVNNHQILGNRNKMTEGLLLDSEGCNKVGEIRLSNPLKEQETLCYRTQEGLHKLNKDHMIAEVEHVGDRLGTVAIKAEPMEIESMIHQDQNFEQSNDITKAKREDNPKFTSYVPVGAIHKTSPCDDPSKIAETMPQNEVQATRCVEGGVINKKIISSVDDQRHLFKYPSGKTVRQLLLEQRTHSLMTQNDNHEQFLHKKRFSLVPKICNHMTQKINEDLISPRELADHLSSDCTHPKGNPHYDALAACRSLQALCSIHNLNEQSKGTQQNPPTILSQNQVMTPESGNEVNRPRTEMQQNSNETMRASGAMQQNPSNKLKRFRICQTPTSEVIHHNSPMTIGPTSFKPCYTSKFIEASHGAQQKSTTCLLLHPDKGPRSMSSSFGLGIQTLISTETRNHGQPEPIVVEPIVEYESSAAGLNSTFPCTSNLDRTVSQQSALVPQPVQLRSMNHQRDSSIINTSSRNCLLNDPSEIFQNKNVVIPFTNKEKQYSPRHTKLLKFVLKKSGCSDSNNLDQFRTSDKSMDTYNAETETITIVPAPCELKENIAPANIEPFFTIPQCKIVAASDAKRVSNVTVKTDGGDEDVYVDGETAPPRRKRTRLDVRIKSEVVDDCNLDEPTSPFKESNENMENDPDKIPKWGASVLKRWLLEQGLSPDFEQFPADELARLLCHFYATITNMDGSLYSPSSMDSIKGSLKKYELFHTNSIDIMRNPTFNTANTIFRQTLRTLKMNEISHAVQLSSEDVTKLYTSMILATDTPVGLQRMTAICLICVYSDDNNFALHTLKRDSFTFHTNHVGKEYVSRKSKGKRTARVWNRPVMYATGGATCPVAILKKYLSKLNVGCKYFFQEPRLGGSPDKNQEDSDSLDDEDFESLWYRRKAVSPTKLSKLMMVISKEVGLSRAYNNTSLAITKHPLLPIPVYEYV